MSKTTFKTVYERVARYFTRERYMSELETAKATYFSRAGKVFEDDPNFEHQMATFLEWYVFDRELDNLAIPPIRAYHLMFFDTFDEKERTVLRSMQRTVRSLCIYQGKKELREGFEDLRTGEQRSIQPDDSVLGLHRGDLVDVRMIELDGHWHLCDTIQVHPQQAKAFMMKELKARKDMGQESFLELLFELSHMKWKREHYKHLSVEQIYRSSIQA